MVAESTALPGDDRSWLHDDEPFPPSRPEPGEPGPEEAVGGFESRPLHGSLADGELVPEGEDLDLHRGPGAKAGAEEREEGHEDRGHEASDPSKVCGEGG